MTNNSGIIPCGHRVLILPEEVQETSKGGIIVMTVEQEKLEALAQTYGRVVEMGPTCYRDQPEDDNGDPFMWCKVGDRVAFAKYSGLLSVGKDGKKYRVINDLDIVSVVEEEVK